MRRVNFALCTLIVLIVLACPAVIFAVLKYNGLEDVSRSLTAEAEEELAAVEESAEDLDTCTVYVNYSGNEFQADSGRELCVVLICRDNACGMAVVDGSLRIVDGQSAELTKLISDKLSEIQNSTDEPAASDNVNKEETDEIREEEQSRYLYPLWQWLSIFSVATVFSVSGVFASVAVRKKSLSDLSLDMSLTTIVMTYFSASLYGVLVVALFAGGFLQGSMFPNFTGDELNFGFNSWSALKFRGADWFKLAVWAYIAGFYERFMPDVFDRIVKKADESESSA